jgi:hypothetical protein
MINNKSVVKQTRPGIQTVGEKLASVLQQPLFTITFPILKQAKHPEKKGHEPPVTAKPVLPKKTVNPICPASGKPSREPEAGRNYSAGIFTHIRNKDEFDKILFAIRACDKNGGAGFTKVLHVEQIKTGSRLIATDGKRLHVTEIRTQIKPGDYKPIVTQDVIRLGKPVSGIQFPNWRRVVPSNVTRRGCLNIEKSVIDERSPVYGSFEKQTGEKVNPRYLADLTKKPWVVYCQKEKRKALLLKERDAKTKTYAVMMPLAA